MGLANNFAKNPPLPSLDEYCTRIGIAAPFFPQKIKKTILLLDHDLFGSRAPLCGLYDIQNYVEDFFLKPVQPYALFGIDGHGVASRAIHYYIVSKKLALFWQLNYANPWNEDISSASYINEVLKLAPRFFSSIKAAHEDDLLPKNRCMVVVESAFYGKGWGWIDQHPTEPNASFWHISENNLLDALANIPKKSATDQSPSKL